MLEAYSKLIIKNLFIYKYNGNKWAEELCNFVTPPPHPHTKYRLTTPANHDTLNLGYM